MKSSLEGNVIVSKNSASDPLAVLKVFDRLEVGPVRLEPRRLLAPYRLFYNGKMEQTELIYSYEETVFDPVEPKSQNLANMIAAQVALNYGLFCESMVFYGLFDDLDHRFIRDMAEKYGAGNLRKKTPGTQSIPPRTRRRDIASKTAEISWGQAAISIDHAKQNQITMEALVGPKR